MTELDTPTGPTIDPMRVLMAFVLALPGQDAFADVNAEKIFAAMKAELPDLQISDLNFAAGIASHLAHRLNAVAWHLRGGKAKPGRKRPAAAR